MECPICNGTGAKENACLGDYWSICYSYKYFACSHCDGHGIITNGQIWCGKTKGQWESFAEYFNGRWIVGIGDEYTYLKDFNPLYRMEKVE